MSCHAKRAALWAEHLAEHGLLPVPHEQWGFTLPKRLRVFLLYDRAMLGDLARCAWGAVRDLYLAGLPNRSAVPGMVASVQTYGDLANWQPHIHALVTSGVIDTDWEFTALDRPSASVAEELFRRRVLKMLFPPIPSQANRASRSTHSRSSLGSVSTSRRRDCI